jgi:hypothetical protein
MPVYLSPQLLAPTACSKSALYDGTTGGHVTNASCVPYCQNCCCAGMPVYMSPQLLAPTACNKTSVTAPNVGDQSHQGFAAISKPFGATCACYAGTPDYMCPQLLGPKACNKSALYDGTNARTHVTESSHHVNAVIAAVQARPITCRRSC